MSETEAIRKLRSYIEQMERRTRRLWTEALSISAGSGCTPFYADARHSEAQLNKAKEKLCKMLKTN